MSTTRIISLVLLLLSAAALAAVMRTSSPSPVHGAGLPGAAVPSVRVVSVADAPVSESLSLPQSVASRATDDEPLSQGRASLNGGQDPGVLDLARDSSQGVIRPASPASLEELREFRAFVSNSLSEIRHEEAAARLKDLERQAASMGLTIPQLVRTLDLTAAQAGKMESLLLSRLDVEAEYWRQWEQGADGEILGELKARDRAAHIEELSTFLTPEQLKDYLAR